MSGHTKGPWAIIAADSLNAGGLELDPSALVIANVNAKTKQAAVVADVWVLDDDGSEQYANARLIAAAPEMLMALKQVDARLRKSLAAAQHFPDAEDERALDAANKAIAKAEGEVQS